jgi:hypothetical protein
MGPIEIVIDNAIVLVLVLVLVIEIDLEFGPPAIRGVYIADRSKGAVGAEGGRVKRPGPEA